ncbi:formyltransferase family protein [Sphingobacterium spiritivorum]|uniref:formyltransferase family protein n=1 Tax=Sphingobacterium spiritivorum TaxID=258 RepID=UPI003DA5267F
MIPEKNIRVGLICNTDIASALAGQLAAENKLAGIAVLDYNASYFKQIFAATGIREQNIQVIDTASWKEQLADWFLAIQADTALVFAFPYRIPQYILDLPPLGIYNIHPGTLPKYSGADPLFWQIKNQEEHIAISIHKMSAAIDRGPLVIESFTNLHPSENYGLLCSRVRMEVVGSVKQWYTALQEDTLIFREQDNITEVYFDRKPSAEDFRIKWKDQPASAIRALALACNPKYGGATSYYGTQEIRILEAELISLEESATYRPGEIVYADGLYGVIAACINGEYLRILTVSMQEGYFSGSKLFTMGLIKGQQLN